MFGKIKQAAAGLTLVGVLTTGGLALGGAVAVTAATAVVEVATADRADAVTYSRCHNGSRVYYGSLGPVTQYGQWCWLDFNVIEEYQSTSNRDGWRFYPRYMYGPI